MLLLLLCLAMCLELSLSFSRDMQRSLHAPPTLSPLSVPVPVSCVKKALMEKSGKSEWIQLLPKGSPLFRGSSVHMTSRTDEYAATVSKKSRWGGVLGAVLRQVNQFVVGLFFLVIVRVLNKFKAIRIEKLLNLVWNRPNERGLLTLSNHQSVMDDPGLFAAVVPWWFLPNRKFRWTICTFSVFNSLFCFAPPTHP